MVKAIKGQRFGGRVAGTPNKATVEKLLIAEREMTQARQGKKLAKEVLEEFMFLFAGMAAYAQPIPDGQPIPANRRPDPTEFEKWARLAVETARDLAKYQSPTFKAIAVQSMPAAPEAALPGPGGKVLELPKDAVSRSRLYQRLVNGR